jgi:dihydroorotase-like cyclic amidohydrolase
MRLDLGLVGGRVVTSGGLSSRNVYVAGGRIASLTDERLPAGRIVDATGLLIMPGMVDAHVHFMDPAATEREDIPTASAAAARSGVTTVIEHSHPGPVRTPEDLRDKATYLSHRSVVDFALAAQAWPGEEDQVPSLWHAGVAFLKAFTCTTHGVPGHDAEHLRGLLQKAATCGAITLVHCEDQTLSLQLSPG